MIKDLAGASVVVVDVVVVDVVEVIPLHFEQVPGLSFLYLFDLHSLQLSF